MSTMNKFMVSSFSVSYNDYDLHELGGCTRNILNSAPPSISLELFPVVNHGDSVDTLSDLVSAGKMVSFIDTDYADWVDHFKDEFKEFLLEKHPESILKDPEGFKKVFGEKCD